MPQSHYRYSSPESPSDYYQPLYTQDMDSYKSRFDPALSYPMPSTKDNQSYYTPRPPASPTGYYARPKSSYRAPSAHRPSPKGYSGPPPPPLNEEAYYSTSPSSPSSRPSRHSHSHSHTDPLFDYDSDDSYNYDKEKLSQRFDRTIPGRKLGGNTIPPSAPRAPSHSSSTRSTAGSSSSSSSRRTHRRRDDKSAMSSININGNDIVVDKRGVKINGKRHELPGGKGMFTVGGVRIIIKEDGTIRVD